MYKSNTFPFQVGDATYYVRALLKEAIIEGPGKVNLPEWLEAQAEIAKQLQDEKLPSVKRTQLEKKLLMPGLLAGYIEESAQSNLFEYQESEEGFTLTPEEIELQNAELLQQNEAKDAEIAALKQRLAELETEKT